MIDMLYGADATALETALRARVRGDVRFDAGTRAMYSTDASNYRQIPICVVLPKDSEDVEHVFAVARKFGAPIVSRGGGTDLAGGACNAAIVVDFSPYMNRVVDIDWKAKIAHVQPGCVLDDLRNAAEARHLTFGPDPATHDRNTLGGMIGNNSCGMHAQMAGKVEENIETLDILTYDGLRMRVGPTSDDDLERFISEGGRKGEIYAGLKALRDKYADKIRTIFPDIPRRVSGYPIDELLPEHGFNVARALVGTEGTCVTVLEAACRLVSSPPCRVLAIFGFPDIATAADSVPFCNAHGPIALEGFDQSMFDHMNDKGMSTKSHAIFPDGNAWLLVEFGAEDMGAARAKAQDLLEAYKARPNPPDGKIVDDKKEERQLWEVREAALGSSSKIPNLPDFYPGWEDSAVAPEKLGDYFREFLKLLSDYDYHASLYGHFGQGCVHCRIDFDLFTADGIRTYRKFVTEAAHLCVKYGGSLSGEHGDGQSRGELLPIMYGDELVRAFEEFKAIWDPQNKMNPGKVVHANKLDDDLRWGTTYEPKQTETHFTFPDDRGSFAYAANRCVGAGKCRKHDSGAMCPSYMVTKEEKYSTRGRARLLFEMLQGDPIRDGWHDETIKDALDFCLACKACKSECPVNVDMATYKAEFLSHYYEGKRRPIGAYAFGLMYWWTKLAAYAPRVVNAFAQTPILSGVAKAVAGIAPQRRIPVFAPQTFRDWFLKRPVPAGEAARGTVILWPDTWNNNFHPSTAQAAVEVLEDAGFRVTIPNVALCCGRPLYDFGMLDMAKRLLEEILDALRPQIREGVCVVGLEPSCVSIFRDEIVNLLGNDEDAKRLQSQTFLLSEFLGQKAPDYQPPQLHRKAVVHQHCHHQSILKRDPELDLLDAMGLECERPDTGCCGMAGAFGFEKKHYDVSIAVGERVLLPRVRESDDRTLIVSDGFSCREQISQTTGRQALHPAQVMKMAIDEARDDTHREDAFPELRYMSDARVESRKAAAAGTALLVAAGMAALCVGVLLLRKK